MISPSELPIASYSDLGAIIVGDTLIIDDDGTLNVDLSSVGDEKFVYNQSIPSNNWSINHGLGKYPSVTVTDSANSVVTGDITYINVNTISIRFNGAFSGKAFLN